MTATRSTSLWILLLGVAVLRLVSLSAYPLLDTTEARYGEIARIMAETGNWIVPQIDYGIPFWGKPPLSFWASALSISTFTNSEFFLRLPHVLAALAVLGLVWQFTRSLDFGRRQADIAVAVVATTIGFLIAAGSVMTDMYLCLAMTLVMTGFWRGWHGDKIWVYIMYAGLGIGLLAKGPVILVLAGFALLPWLAICCGLTGMWKPLWQRLKLPSGLLLMLLIAAPWYWMAEQSSPGFLDYFIIGEHFHRFVDSGWQGDLYGSAHAQARGTIWIYWLIFSLPWSPLLLLAAGRGLLRRKSPIPRDRSVLFLLLWLCSPMLLFTLAGNILPAYVLPGLPATGLLVLKIMPEYTTRKRRYLLFAGPTLLLAICIYANLVAADKHSDKELLAGGVDSADELFYLHDRPFSAQYYSNGRARITETFPDSDSFYLAIERNHSLEKVENNCALRSGNFHRQLYFCRAEPTA